MAENQYEREIDELLKRLEGERREPLAFHSRRRTPPWAAAWRRLTTLLGPQSTVERLMVLAVGLLLGTFLLGFFAPRLAGLIGVLAVACFVAALALSVWAGSQGRGPSRHWRGQPYSPAGQVVDWNALGWRLRRWLRRFRR